MEKRAIKTWEYKHNGYKRRVRLYKDGVELYYQIYVGKTEQNLLSFQDCLNRYYPIGYRTDIDTEVMNIVAERMMNLEVLNEQEMKFYQFWKHIDCSKIPTQIFKSSYEKSHIKISPTGVHVKIHRNNYDPSYGEDSLDSIFFYGPEIPIMSLEDRIKLRQTLFDAIDDKADLAVTDGFPLFDFSKLPSEQKEYIIGDRYEGESITLSPRGCLFKSDWSRWEGGSHAVGLEEVWRHRAKNMSEGRFQAAYKEIYAFMEEAIIKE